MTLESIASIIVALVITCFSSIKTFSHFKDYWGLLQEQVNQKYQINENGKKVELLLLELIHASHVACAIVEPEGAVYPNKAFATLLNWPIKDLRGKTWMSFTHPDYLEADMDYVKQMLDGKITSYTLDKVYIDYKGFNVSVRLKVILSRHINGSPHKFIVSAHRIPDLLPSHEGLGV